MEKKEKEKQCNGVHDVGKHLKKKNVVMRKHNHSLCLNPFHISEQQVYYSDQN